ncbi:MAG: tRNA (adenosine(37)-N6)-threonylcarbamoyltransferase complex dimerization subunit type 1 TsaB [Cyanobacteria bacterium P01_D01_bin.105]
MLGLAIHTSSPQLGLMIQALDDAVDNRHQVWDLGREVSSQLHVKMMEFIAPHTWQDVSFVAVAKGPGGFTGTRIGVVVARTLAQQLDIPLFGVSSLGAVAAQFLGSDISNIVQDIVVTMPAKREAVYGAIFRPDGNGDLQMVRAETVMPQGEWESVVRQWQDKGHPIEEVKMTAGEGSAVSVTGVMALALARWRAGERPEWGTVMPFYGQHPVHR